MAANEEFVMWVENYRPKTLDECVDPTEVVEGKVGLSMHW
jgi:hypothetical protein